MKKVTETIVKYAFVVMAACILGAIVGTIIGDRF